jgi:hypothetical protein
MAMQKMLERAVLYAYRRAIALGADGIEAFETALAVVFDARPDIDDDAGRGVVATIIAAAGDAGQRPIAAGAMLHARKRSATAGSSPKP